jgi:DmsE family decaheme c-type cytochrome
MFRDLKGACSGLHASARRRLGSKRWRRAWRWSRISLAVVVVLAVRAYAADAPATAGAYAVKGRQAAGPKSPKERKVPEPEAIAQCSVCHADQAQAWSSSVHRRTVNAPQIPKARQGCTACHVNVAAHLEDPSAAVPGLSLIKMGADKTITLCTSCHKDGQQIMFRTSAHAKLPKACLSCHHPHKGEGREMLLVPEPELCDRCHPQQAAETRLPSHHPIPEGKMVCSDCHSVHGDQRNNLSQASPPELCYKCHSDKAGPFVNEHPPVTEDCAICHKPHGAQNDRLLVMDMPMLCLRCHPGHHDSHRTPLVATGSTTAAQQQALLGMSAFYTKCTSCHSLIHGTDLSSGSGNPTFMPGRPAAPLDRSHAASSLPYFGAAALSALTLSGDGASWGFSDFELGAIDETGNRAYVREYDGKKYTFPRVKFSEDQYAKSSDFHFSVSDLGAGDEEAQTYFGTPTVSADIKYTAMTHRLPRFNDLPERVNIANSGGRTVAVTPDDLTHGENDFALGRKVTEINMYARHPKLAHVRWLAKYWRQSKVGRQQFTFLDRCSSCHKVQVAEPINQVTTNVSGGAELEFKRGAVRYMHGEDRFENRAPEGFFNFTGVSTMFNGLAPLFGVADTKTNSDEVRLSAVPNDRLALTGLYAAKRRRDLYANSRLKIASAGGGVSYRFRPDLDLVASFYSHDFDNTARLINEDAMDRDRQTIRTELRYTGLPWTTIAAGYRRESVARDTAHELLPRKSDANIWSANAITNFPNGATLNVRYRRTTTGLRLNFDPSEPDLDLGSFPARWIAPPTHESFLSAVASYGFARDLMGTLLYSKLDQSFDVEVSELSVARHSDNSIRTLGAEAGYNVGRRTKVSAGVYQQRGKANADVTYGGENFVLAPPLSPEGSITFPPINSTALSNYDALIFKVDGAHWLTRRLRIFGRYALTHSNGEVIANDIGDYLDQNPDLNGINLLFNPFDIRVTDQWLGVSYLLDPFTELALSWEKRAWINRSDATQDGHYDLWRIGVRMSL